MTDSDISTPTDDRRDDPRVLYIAGWGRCGSTLLDMMLGQIDGCVSAGEVREIWLRGCSEDRPCSCDRAFSACEFWSQVGEVAFGGWHRLDLDEILRVRYFYDRPWGFPWTLREPGRDDIRDYLDALSTLLRAIATVAGASVVIDSSKLPSHGLLLRHTPGIDLRTLHLVREPRGVAWSVQKDVAKKVSSGEETALPRHGAVAASARYTLYNGLSTAYGRLVEPYARLRYEDLIDHTERELRGILELVGLARDTPLPFLGDGTVTFAPNHLVDGNPVRFSTGAVPLRRDEAWREELPEHDRRTVSVLTAPLRRIYGYR